MFPEKKVEEDERIPSLAEKKPDEIPENSINSVNSSTNIGSPLQTSSPSATRFPTNGDGDRHSIRSVRLSPIRCSGANHNMIDTPSTSPMPVTLDSFLGNFEKSSPPAAASPSSVPHHLEQELLLSEVSGMGEDEAKKILAKVLVDNMGLRQELRNKEKRITAYKGQMLAILDWKARQESDGDNSDGNPQMPSRVAQPRSGAFKGLAEKDDNAEMIPQKTIHSSKEVTFVEEGYGMRRSLSIIQELAMSIDVDQELLRERLKRSYHMTNQLLLGGAAGWLTAIFVKKFGKLALSATGGGLCLLVYTARKGFVHVNYESIYEEISKLCGDNATDTDNPNMDTFNNNDMANLSGTHITNCDGSFDKGQASLGTSMNADCSKSAEELRGLGTYEKIKQAKNWIASHTYTVGGFALSFAYNIF